MCITPVIDYFYDLITINLNLSIQPNVTHHRSSATKHTPGLQPSFTNMVNHHNFITACAFSKPMWTYHTQSYIMRSPLCSWHMPGVLADLSVITGSPSSVKEMPYISRSVPVSSSHLVVATEHLLDLEDGVNTVQLENDKPSETNNNHALVQSSLLTLSLLYEVSQVIGSLLLLPPQLTLIKRISQETCRKPII